MKHILLLIIVFNLSMLNAQITLTSNNHTPIVGDSISYITLTNPNNNAGDDGPNQSWDFSNIIGTANFERFISINNSVDSSMHSHSNIINLNSDSNLQNELFYTYTDSSVTYDGQLTAIGSIEYYNNPRDVIKFPFTYLDSLSDLFTGNWINNQIITHDSFGSSFVKADSYGDLILPSGTVSNCLRIMTVWNITWDQIGSNNIQSFIDTTYKWYNMSSNNFIASYSITYQDSTTSWSKFKYQNEPSLLIHNGGKVDKSKVRFFPIPARNTIYFNDSQITNVKVYCIDGTLKKESSNFDNENEIDVTDLSSGIYLIRFLSDNKLFTEKIVINK